MKSDEVQGLDLDSGGEKLTWNHAKPEEKPAYDLGPEEKNPRRGSWAPAAALVVFAAIFFPLIDHPWALYPAILASYSVFIFGMSFWTGGFSLDKDAAQRCLPKLFAVHSCFMALVAGCVAVWLWLQPQLPVWLTVRGRKGSLWDWILTFSLLGVAFWQGSRMARVVEANSDDLRFDGQ